MKKTYLIKGMHCNSCATSINDALKDLEGVKSAKVSYEKGEAIVEFDDNKINSKKIIEEIKKVGYKAEELVDGKKKGFFGGIFNR